MQFQRSTAGTGTLSSSRFTPKDRLDVLGGQVKALLRTSRALLWDEDLLEQLTERVEQGLRANGLIKEEYGTERILSHDCLGERTIVKAVPLSLLSPDWTVPVELLGQEGLRVYSDVRFYDAKEILSSNVLDCLSDAMHVLDRLPAIPHLINSLVKSLHLIRPYSVDFDLSFSEPRLPFSIFVSVPLRRIQNDSLRVAEGILHEAMHLHLSLIESVVPLTKVGGNRHYSPWRDEPRTAQGLLHAIYVFRIIRDFWETVKIAGAACGETLYIETRLTQITAQLSRVHSFSESGDLTDEGRGLVAHLLDPTQSVVELSATRR